MSKTLFNAIPKDSQLIFFLKNSCKPLNRSNVLVIPRSLPTLRLKEVKIVR